MHIQPKFQRNYTVKRPPVIFIPNTPRWNEVLAELLDLYDRTIEGSEFVDFIHNEMFFDKLCYVNKYGHRLKTPLSIAEKMETMLEIAEKMRAQAVKKINKKAEQPLRRHQVLTEQQMSTVMNNWKHNVKSWMHKDNLPRYKRLKEINKKAARTMIQSSHRTHVFHVAGCPWMLRNFIKVGIVTQSSKNRAKVLLNLLESFREYQDSNEYKEAVQKSQKKNADKRRLSSRIWVASRQVERGRMASLRAKKEGEWKLMSDSEQQLAHEFDTYILQDALYRLMEAKDSTSRDLQRTK